MKAQHGDVARGAALANAARDAGVQDRRVLDALRNVDRTQFVPAESVGRAHDDVPLPIGHRQVTTQPSLVARMVEALRLTGVERVLEVGTGFGYQTAILAALADHVYSIERFADFSERARANLQCAGVRNATVCVGDGTLGLAAHAPYRAIVVAAAARTVPPALVEQLEDEGRLVQPIGQGGDEIVTAFRKRSGALVEEGVVTPACFVPLVSESDR